MSALQVSLSADERQYLCELLDSELKETRVEEHRTRTPSYRDHIVEREKLIDSLLAKLKGADACRP